MRYTIDSPGLEHNFVEFSDSWSRAQTRATWAAWADIPNAPDEGEASDVYQARADAAASAFLDTLRPKIIALHLDGAQGLPPIATPADLVWARFDDIDERVYRWWLNVWMAHLRGLADLGNALGRQLLSTSAGSISNGTTKPTPNKTAARPNRKR